MGLLSGMNVVTLQGILLSLHRSFSRAAMKMREIQTGSTSIFGANILVRVPNTSHERQHLSALSRLPASGRKVESGEWLLCSRRSLVSKLDIFISLCSLSAFAERREERALASLSDWTTEDSFCSKKCYHQNTTTQKTTEEREQLSLAPALASFPLRRGQLFPLRPANSARHPYYLSWRTDS